MKKTLTLFLLTIVLTITACAPSVAATSAPPSAAEPTEPIATQIPTVVESQSAGQKAYTNSIFGLGFQYPPNWFGPDEYVSEQTLRVSIGSDVVYPYGTSREEQIHAVRNSYYVVIQYSKNDQNLYWREIYQSLLNLQDGESLTEARNQMIRVRQIKSGEFEGIEYISTLSETTQTEPAYSREVILIDGQSNLLTISGSPNNVEVGNGAEWRDVYRTIDEANQVFFHMIVESIMIK